MPMTFWLSYNFIFNNEPHNNVCHHCSPCGLPVNLAMPDASVCVDPQMSPPDEGQARLLRQIVLAGMGDHVARSVWLFVRSFVMLCFTLVTLYHGGHSIWPVYFCSPVMVFCFYSACDLPAASHVSDVRDNWTWLIEMSSIDHDRKSLWWGPIH